MSRDRTNGRAVVGACGRSRVLGSLTVFALLASAGCGDRVDMVNQPRFEAYESTPLFPEGAASRHLPPGAVPREVLVPDPENPRILRRHAEAPLDRPAITAALLANGRSQFDVYCAPCHARDGYGAGMVVRRGFPRPPSLHDVRIRSAPDEHIHRIMTLGLGKMPPYARMLSSEERWAVVAYVRALQLSQRAEFGTLSPDERRRLLDPGAEPASEEAP